MERIARPIGCLLAMALLGACSHSPVAPTPPAGVDPPATSAPPAPTAKPPLPPLSEGRVFAFQSAAQTGQTLAWYTPGSRYVLFDNGMFVLEYPHGSYRGTYKQDGPTITFEWEGWSVAGPWGATGTLLDDQLTVRYNMIMIMSDFEDAIYTLKPPSS